VPKNDTESIAVTHRKYCGQSEYGSGAFWPRSHIPNIESRSQPKHTLPPHNSNLRAPKNRQNPRSLPKPSPKRSGTAIDPPSHHLNRRLDWYQTRSSRKTMTPDQLKTIVKESVREALREEWLKFYQLNLPHVSDTEQAEIEADLGIPADYDEDDFIDITDLFDHAG
jgi:hypothetical protein